MYTTVNVQSWWGKKRIKGNGNIINDIRTTGDFDRISVGGFFDVILEKRRRR
tara:strand:+ start:484 stop:639 length:156 start_codon:yes stop_codon:yes gene_type:complete